jgi:hypothetical protein
MDWYKDGGTMEHEELNNLINDAAITGPRWSSEPVWTANLTKAKDHLQKSINYHDAGDYKSAHASLLTAISHLKAHHTNSDKDNYDYSANKRQLQLIHAEGLGMSYKHGYEL